MIEPYVFYLTPEEAKVLWNWVKNEHVPVSKEHKGIYDLIKKLADYIYAEERKMV
jgi:hypothetical protein